MGRGGIWLLGFIVFHAAPVAGQQLVRGDSQPVCSFVREADSGLFRAAWRLTQECGYLLAADAEHTVNRMAGAGPGSLSLHQQLKYSAEFRSGDFFRMSGRLTHELGIRHWFDSLTLFSPDLTSWDLRIEFRGKTRLGGSLLSSLTTPLFNRYETTGPVTGRLTGGFCTPLVWEFSVSLTATADGIGSADLGLTGGRFTWIGNRKAIPDRDEPDRFGIPDGSRSSLTTGAFLFLSVNRMLFGFLHWEADLRLYARLRKPPEMKFRNQFGWQLTRFLRFQTDTRLVYDPGISSKIQLENRLLLGFSPTLRSVK